MKMFHNMCKNTRLANVLSRVQIHLGTTTVRSLGLRIRQHQHYDTTDVRCYCPCATMVVLRSNQVWSQKFSLNGCYVNPAHMFKIQRGSDMIGPTCCSRQLVIYLECRLLLFNHPTCTLMILLMVGPAFFLDLGYTHFSRQEDRRKTGVITPLKSYVNV